MHQDYAFSVRLKFVKSNVFYIYMFCTWAIVQWYVETINFSRSIFVHNFSIFRITIVMSYFAENERNPETAILWNDIDSPRRKLLMSEAIC